MSWLQTSGGTFIAVASLVLILAVALSRPELGSHGFQVFGRILNQLAGHRWLPPVVVGLTSALACLAVALLTGWPVPWGHDAFSYLLAGDTFAQGRLTNPTHPLWPHFESFHIIHQPTYASKYPPAHGLCLAVGQVLTGQPIVGVWLATVLACVAVWWMLRAWLPARWALIGGLLTAIHPTILLWCQSYWGIAATIAGGALVTGAMRRIATSIRTRDVVIMGLGMTILVNSRPYEGMVLSVLAGGVAAWLVFRGQGLLMRVIWPVTIVLALAGTWMGYYNWRVTSSPWRLPYMVHETSYAIAPPFVWQHPRPPPAYRFKELRVFHEGWELHSYQQQRTPAGFVRAAVTKLGILAKGLFPIFVLGLPMVLVAGWLMVFVWLARERWMRVGLLIGGGFSAALLPVSWFNVHYAAPVFALAAVLVLQSLRHVRAWHWRGRRSGKFLVRAALVLGAVAFAPTCAFIARDKAESSGQWRARLLTQLRREPGRHLVIVRYADAHAPEDEWVYNAADIDNAPVVWAREMGAVNDRELVRYFSDRRIWLLEADAQPPRLSTYPRN